jgi:thiol:disulfide interchange protein DsbC
MNRLLLSMAALMAIAGCAQAGDPELEKVRKNVSGKLPGVTAEMVTPSAAPGLYQVQHGQEFGYVTRDGRYFIVGDMIDLVTGDEITEQLRGASRQAVVKQFGPDEVIEFAPKDPKYFITVFTDIDCGYCRKLHSHIAEYNADGIAVRYLFFPRSGPDTESFYKAEKVWCAADRKAALTQAKLGPGYEGDKSCKNPVMDHLHLASQLGLRGTPAIVLPDGELIPGYQTPEQLLKVLAQHETPVAGPSG